MYQKSSPAPLCTAASDTHDPCEAAALPQSVFSQAPSVFLCPSPLDDSRIGSGSPGSPIKDTGSVLQVVLLHIGVELGTDFIELRYSEVPKIANLQGLERDLTFQVTNVFHIHVLSAGIVI